MSKSHWLEQLTLEKIQKISKPSAALVNVAERPGMPFRRYGQNNTFKRRDFNNWRPKKAPDGKNPIRNNARLLCRNCKSDEHLLWECPELSTPKRVSFTSIILGSECTVSDSDECNHATEIAQGFDDDAWSNLMNDVIMDSNVNDTYFTSKVDSQSYTTLADVSFHHSITSTPEKISAAESREVLFTSNNSTSFEGICMDDGAEKSLAGVPAFERCCSFTN